MRGLLYSKEMMSSHYDLCIIGGGINGAGIARDAAGRGFSVLLLEQGDLAQATSSASTKLIHGGLRYLEMYEFRLVRESLNEREVLLDIAPHIIHPMEFVLPHHPGIRPLWLIRAGLYLYDRLGGRKKLPASKALDFATHPAGNPLKKNFTKGFSYADCRVDDARLVVLNAMDARKKGATILTHSACTSLMPDGDQWNIGYQGKRGEKLTATASMVVNAAGPWAEKFLRYNGFYEVDQAIPVLKLVKGSHIIIPRLYEGDHAYILQQKDGRIVFAIPYEGAFTLIGTTDEPYKGDVAHVQISQSEIEYLCAAVSEFFERKIFPMDVVSTYSGVRALYDDGRKEARKVTRDYVIYHHKNYNAPMLSIFGGKITTYRKLSEEVVDRLCNLKKDEKPSWTEAGILPGGDVKGEDYYAALYGWLPPEVLRRYIRLYGSRLEQVIGDAVSLLSMGAHFGDGVYAHEIRYLMREEFAHDVSDILLRRTKLGLHVSKSTRDNIARFIAQMHEKEMA